VKKKKKEGEKGRGRNLFSVWSILIRRKRQAQGWGKKKKGGKNTLAPVEIPLLFGPCPFPRQTGQKKGARPHSVELDLFRYRPAPGGRRKGRKKRETKGKKKGVPPPAEQQRGDRRRKKRGRRKIEMRRVELLGVHTPEPQGRKGRKKKGNLSASVNLSSHYKVKKTKRGGKGRTYHFYFQELTSFSVRTFGDGGRKKKEKRRKSSQQVTFGRGGKKEKKKRGGGRGYKIS